MLIGNVKFSAELVARPLHSPFTIARGTRTIAETIVATVRSGGYVGRGECVPLARHAGTVEDTLAQINALPERPIGADWRSMLTSSSARNAVDCAIWDLRAKMEGRLVKDIVDAKLSPVQTAQTLSLDTPERMAAAATRLSDGALIKVKLGGKGDIERMIAIRQARPDARLIVDANEGWSVDDYQQIIPQLVAQNIEMIEQPFHADRDEALAGLDRPIKICADESCSDSSDLLRLLGLYDMINIKLDKTGGLTEAMKLRSEAIAAKMPFMIGCMVGSSLAMAPAFLLTDGADYVDLDGPLFLAEDEEFSIEYKDGVMYPFQSKLWG